MKISSEKNASHANMQTLDKLIKEEKEQRTTKKANEIVFF